MISYHPRFNCTRNAFRILSRKEDDFFRGLQANGLAEATGPVSEKEGMVAEVWNRSAAVGQELQYVSYLYLEHINSASTINALKMVHTNSDKWFLYKR